MVDVTVLAPNGEAVQVAALVDSGADFCLFPLTTAGMLSLKVESLPTEITFGVGSASNLTYFDDLVLDLGNGVILTTRVGFTEGMVELALACWGKWDFSRTTMSNSATGNELSPSKPSEKSVTHSMAQQALSISPTLFDRDASCIKFLYRTNLVRVIIKTQDKEFTTWHTAKR